MKYEKAYKGCGWSFIAFLLVLIAWLLMGCKSVQYVPVKEVVHDSIYFSQLMRDSIWMHDSVLVREKGDTVRIEKWHTKYIEKQVRDTVYQSKTDSIPVPYPVTKYVEKPLGWFEKLLMWTGILALMAIVIIVARWLSKWKAF